MRSEPHPISGAIYEELGGGRVRVRAPKDGKQGIFAWDGTWLEGELTHADPHFLLYVGGPNLPEGTDVYWALTPPEGVSAADAGTAYGGGSLRSAGSEPPRIVARYVGDPGKVTELGVRSAAHIDLDQLLDNDRCPELVPSVYRLQSPMDGGPQQINTDRFHQKRYHDLEVDRIWKRCWQMVCREDDIPGVGDYHVYTIAHLSFIIVRTGEDEYKAHYNACPHRGRQLRETDGKCASEFRCPYHGWSWRIDGGIKEITCEWDFPGVREDVATLPGARVSTWAGFIFINPDPDCEPLETFLGPVMMAHYEKFNLRNRYKQAHVRRVMHANWKVTMEAFMEAYHVIATHPQLMLAGPDSANARYDVFGNWGRAGHLSSAAVSAQRGIYLSEEDILKQYRLTADGNRDFLRGIIGDEVEQYSDAELNDTSFNDLFPNLHPWGGWARIVFRFWPHGNNPDESIMDVMLLAPWPEGKAKPASVPLRSLSVDQSWCEAPELGSLARIIDQDVHNLSKIQAGLKTKCPPFVWYSAYQEGKIRNFHRNYDDWIKRSGHAARRQS
jgi:nitrite reductase/ring-hydroxylating ferredoxin subunit